MRKSIPLFLVLSLLGFAIGPSLDGLVRKDPRRLASVGENLLGARLGPDGRLVAGVGLDSEGWFCAVWDLKNTRILQPVRLPAPPGRFPAFCWLPDGKRIAVAAGAEVWIVEVNGGRRTTLAAEWLVRQLDCRGNSLMARTDTATFVWDAGSGELRWCLSQNYLLYAALDDTGRWLATGCFDDGVRVFDVARKKQLQHLDRGRLPCGLQFAEGRLLYGLRDRDNRKRDSVKIFDVKSGRYPCPTLSTPQLAGFQVSSDGSKVVSRHGRGATVWNATRGKILSQREGDARLLDAISPSGIWVATTPPESRAVALWNSEDSSRHHTLEGPGTPDDVHFEANDRLMVVDGAAHLWQIP